MKNKRVAVLRGGPSEEHEVSIKTGAAVLQAMRDRVSYLSDIVITKQGQWLQDGLIKSKAAALQGFDVVFLALHGAYGEDGEIQKYLQRHNIPFTGSRAFPSAVAFNKDLTKRSLVTENLPFLLPQHKLVDRSDLEQISSITEQIKQSFGFEYIIKPNTSGSSVGIKFVRAHESLNDALTDALREHEQVIVEEFIRGREATCAILENFRDVPLYAFPVIEIIPPAAVDFFNNEVKYNGSTQKICPGNFSYSEREVLHEAAKIIHKSLQLSQYSRSDFIVRDGRVYFLEVNTLPGLTSESLYPTAAAAVGLSFPDLVELLVRTAKI